MCLQQTRKARVIVGPNETKLTPKEHHWRLRVRVRIRVRAVIDRYAM